MEAGKSKAQKHQTSRKAFYEQAVRLTGFPESKCREILKAAFGDNFQVEQIPKYFEELKGHAELARTQQALDRMKAKIRGRLQETPKPEPCPIPSCKGIKVAGRPFRWVCSVGGLRHFLVAEHCQGRNISLEIYLAQVNALDKEGAHGEGKEKLSQDALRSESNREVRSEVEPEKAKGDQAPDPDWAKQVRCVSPQYQHTAPTLGAD